METLKTCCAQETYELGRALGERLGPGDVVALIGDLGAGKTVFTQGVASGLHIQELVNSPTFTILQIYEEGRLPFYHFDVYRIGDPEEMEEIGFDEYVYGEGVSMIEWANLIEELLPEHRIEVRIERRPDLGDSYRVIRIARLGE